MDALLEEIKNARKVSTTTLKTYQNKLNKLANLFTGEDFKNIDFLKTDFDKIKEFLMDKSNSTRKVFTAAIMSAISPKGRFQYPPNFEKEYKEYNDMIKATNQQYYNSIANNTKSEHDKQNWTTWSNILKIPKMLLKMISAQGIKLTKYTTPLNKKQTNLVRDALISKLYTDLPPRRLDIAKSIFIMEKAFKKLSDNDKDNNVYLVCANNKKYYFSFGKNSVKSQTATNTIVKIPSKLNTILTFWRDLNGVGKGKKNQAPLFENMNENKLSKLLTQIFSPTGKNISVNLLRKIHDTSKYGDSLKSMKEDADAMNHSVAIQQKVYVKTD